MERVRIVDGEPRLVGIRCAGCGHTSFPSRWRCPACGSVDPLAEAVLGRECVVQSAVELFVSTEEHEAPYTLGFVRLDDGVTLLARVDGTGEPGARVRLVADEEVDTFWFATVAPAAAAPARFDDETREGGDRP